MTLPNDSTRRPSPASAASPAPAPSARLVLSPSSPETEAERQMVLHQALAPTYDRMTRESAGLPDRLECLVLHIRDFLLSPDLNVQRSKLACGIRDNSVAIAFHRELGEPPHAYLTAGRHEVGCRLLASTDLPVWRISKLVGFSSIQVYSRSFLRFHGQRPTAYRKAQASPGEEAASEAAPSASPPPRGGVLDRLLEGEGTQAEASAVIARLSALYSSAGA